MVKSCPGSAGNCEPRFVWSGTVNSGTNYYAGYLNNGGFGNSNYTYTYAFGVRCVLDLDYKTFCDLNSGYGALQCKTNTSGCPGATNNNCYPNIVWGGTSSAIVEAQLNSGSFKVNDSSAEYAQSVRCVLDLKVQNSYNEQPSLQGKRQQRSNPEKMQTTATRTTYGQVQRVTTSIMTSN